MHRKKKRKCLKDENKVKGLKWNKNKDCEEFNNFVVAEEVMGKSIQRIKVDKL